MVNEQYVEAPCALQTETDAEVINFRCETCQFIASHRERLLLRSITVVFLLLELVLSFACFAIEVGFEICMNYIRYYVEHPAENNVHLMVTRTRLTYMTTAAVGIIFVPLILVSLAWTRKFCVFSCMSIILGIAGFVCFLSVGVTSFVHVDLPGGKVEKFQGLGGIALATAVLFLVHVIYEIWKRVFRAYPFDG